MEIRDRHMTNITAPKITEKKKTFSARLKDLIYDIEVRIFCGVSYFISLFKNGFQPKIAIFYPEKPKKWHTLYTILPVLGYKITSDENAKADIAVAFADTTFRNEDATLARLSAKYKVININCADISKEKVEKIFKEIFGYESNVNSRTYRGKYIRKSNLNGKHDGKIYTSPVEPEEGYIYQKIINNRDSDNLILDLRVFIINGTIPFVVKRYRAIDNRFNDIKKAVLVKKEEVLNNDEVDKILLFSKKFGMDYGELDVLRDIDDGKIYIVDANNTPSNHCQWAVVSRREYYHNYLKKLTGAFESGFLGKRTNFIAKIKDLLFDIEVVIYSKACYLLAISKNGFKPKIALCYPEIPKTYHILFSILHKLGYKITSDINSKADIAIVFSDTTIRKEDSILTEFSKKNKVINIACNDISKEKVERIFKETFGYGIGIDPKIYKGKCVRKSNLNGKHDGKIINCPAEPEEGYVYQKIINNQDGNIVTDFRVIIMNNSIPLILKRYRNVDDRFDRIKKSSPVNLDDCLNQKEINKILLFCKKFGLDCGELDILRDRADNKIYIVDVNNTPATLRMGKHISRREYYSVFLTRMTKGFASGFLNGHF